MNVSNAFATNPHAITKNNFLQVGKNQPEIINKSVGTNDMTGVVAHISAEGYKHQRTMQYSINMEALLKNKNERSLQKSELNFDVEDTGKALDEGTLVKVETFEDKHPYLSKFQDLETAYSNATIGTGQFEMDIFSKMATRYADVRSEIEEKYEGTELEEQLRKLEDSFDFAMDRIVGTISMEVSFSIIKEHMNTSHQMHHMKEQGYDENSKEMSELKKKYELTKEILAHFDKMGDFVKKYLSADNDKSLTSEEKQIFEDYIARKTSE